jgi:hypothetical protein
MMPGFRNPSGNIRPRRVQFLSPYKVLILIAGILAIASATHVYSLPLGDISTYDEAVASMVQTSKQYLGRPYKFRNPQGAIMDCSGFVQWIYDLHGVKIPRTATTQYQSGIPVPLSQARPGDLMFFRNSGSSSNRIGHVSMIVETDGDNLKMIHSSSRGVVIDNYPAMTHYVKRFLYAARMPQLEARYPRTPAPDRIISVIGVGDIMLGTNYPSEAYLPPNDGKGLLSPVKEILSSADITFANLEGTFLTGKGPVKEFDNPTASFAFKSPDHYAGYLKEAGIDIVSIANNHIADFGVTGKRSTVMNLDRAGIRFAGLLEYPTSSFTQDGIRYGFCAFAPNASTLKLNDYAAASRIIRDLESRADIVIVSFHAGAEGSEYRNVTRSTERYLDENRGNPYEFARMAIDAGADIVFGHGPHVTRAIDLYKNRFIAYSLGNFCTYGRMNISGHKGVAPVVKVSVNQRGEFREAEIVSIRQNGLGGPVLDDAKEALREIRELTLADFPESPLEISLDGKVLPKAQPAALSLNR